MAFSLFDRSGRLGRPVTLYEITWGATVWRYTSADREIEWPAGSGTYWTAIPISDSGFTSGPQAEPLTITLPALEPVVQLFRSTPPSLSIWIKVRRFHESDADKEGIVCWVGTASNVKRAKDPITAQLLGIPLDGTLTRAGLRDCWERNCPYSVYGADCRADKELFKTVTTITAIDAGTVTVASLGAYTGEQYNGGFFEWIASTEGTHDTRGLEHYLGSSKFNLLGSADRLTVGLSITMYLGCDLTAATCQGTFNNLANRGGMDFLPGVSPFDGRQLFY